MYLYNEYIAPAELTGYVRAALADLSVNQFTLGRFLPNNPIDDLDYRFTAGGEGLVEAATFRNYDTPSPFGKREGVRRISGELPPISRQIRLGEYERLRRRAAGNDAVLSAIENDAVRMTRAVAARMELARGEALVSGKVVLNENGVQANVDFGRDAGNSVTSATLWSDTTNASVLSDEISWRDSYVATNGAAPEVQLVSTTVLRLMQRNKEIIDAIAGSAAGRTRVNLDELNALLQSESLPRVEVNDAQVNVGGTATRVIGDTKVLFLPAPVDPNSPESTDLGATLWGTTAESLDPDYGIEEADQPGIVAGVYRQENPINLFTNAAGIGLPVLANPNLSFAATVR